MAAGDLSPESAPGEELVSLVTCDLAGLVRGRSIPLADLERRLEIGVGWVPANQSISAFGDLAEPNPWGSVGDVRLLPDAGTLVRLDRWPGVAPLHLVLCDIAEVDGSDWDACGRTFLRGSLERLQQHAGVWINAAFEHELVLDSPGPAPAAFSLEAQRTAEPFGSQVMAALREAGVEPEMFLPEYGDRQFEIPVAAAAGVAAADRSVVLKEVVREVARRLGRRVSFAPLHDPEGVGTGTHIHISLVDEAGRSLGYDPARAGGLSLIAGRFAAGVLRHLPAVLALTAPSPHSYARLVPHRWSAAAAVLGERNREAALRICPVVPLGGMTAQAQIHLEFRAADATASPYLALGALVSAGLEGIREELEPPPVVQAGQPIELERSQNAMPRSLAEALEALESDAVARAWLAPRLLDTYLGLKRLELSLVSDLELEEVCRLYASVH
ncbi:MAG: glutamine synthetase [Gaiellales bacterium]|jgi:glutamine synthetase|nr:glutamine synthetase [Gaiellales bacterium]